MSTRIALPHSVVVSAASWARFLAGGVIRPYTTISEMAPKRRASGASMESPNSKIRKNAVEQTATQHEWVLNRIHQYLQPSHAKATKVLIYIQSGQADDIEVDAGDEERENLL